MKTILCNAMSVNGMIATQDYGEDFLNGTWKHWVEQGEKCGCIIWGRTTYELVNKWPPKYIESIKDIKKIIISSNPQLSLRPNDQLFANPPEALKALETQGYSKVLLSGGSKTNSSFAKLGLIDEMILIVDSIIEGKGIPLFIPENFELKLKPLKTEILDNHLISLHFQVIK